MKTPEEEAQFIFDDCPGIVCENMAHKNLKYRIALSFKNREREVREDLIEAIGKIPVSEIETPMDMFNRVSEIIIKDSIKLNPKAVGDHDWIKRDGNDFKFCRICNTVKRADGKNKPCKGPVKLTLRNK